MQIFPEHNYVIWGTKCTCGEENYVLQNQFHPWNETDYKIKIKCSKCNRQLEIDHLAAEAFYNKKIYHFFNDVEGTILDIGSGGGFLTQQLIDKQNVNKVYAIDIDNQSEIEINKLVDMNKNVKFKCLDVKDISETFEAQSIDYIVNRDVFMFMEDPEKYFNDVTTIARKGLRQMGWFINGNKRMKNNLSPYKIVEELKQRKWKVELEILDWYKSGYFIKADK